MMGVPGGWKRVARAFGAGFLPTGLTLCSFIFGVMVSTTACAEAAQNSIKYLPKNTELYLKLAHENTRNFTIQKFQDFVKKAEQSSGENRLRRLYYALQFTGTFESESAYQDSLKKFRRYVELEKSTRYKLLLAIDDASSSISQEPDIVNKKMLSTINGSNDAVVRAIANYNIAFSYIDIHNSEPAISILKQIRASLSKSDPTQLMIDSYILKSLAYAYLDFGDVEDAIQALIE